MADSMSFDFSELDKLAADLGEVAPTAGPLINSAVQYTSKETVKSAQKKVGRRKHFKQAAQAIDYEVKVVFGQLIQSEIGYDKDKTAGPLGNLIEFGAEDSTNSLAPGNELQRALHENEEDFVKGLEKAIEDAEKKAGF